MAAHNTARFARLSRASNFSVREFPSGGPSWNCAARASITKPCVKLVHLLVCASLSYNCRLDPGLAIAQQLLFCSQDNPFSPLTSKVADKWGASLPLQPSLMVLSWRQCQKRAMMCLLPTITTPLAIIREQSPHGYSGLMWGGHSPKGKIKLLVSISITTGVKLISSLPLLWYLYLITGWAFPKGSMGATQSFSRDRE